MYVFISRHNFFLKPFKHEFKIHVYKEAKI